MSSLDQVKWQPISQLSLIASMIDDALNDTRDHLQTLTEARGRPHVLDDPTVDRVKRVHQEQLAFVDIYAEQLRRWRAERPSAAQQRELERLEAQNSCLRQATRGVLDLAAELRTGTIDRIMEHSDLELGPRTLLSGRPPRR